MNTIRIKGLTIEDKFELICDGYNFWLVDGDIFKFAFKTIEQAKQANVRYLTNYSIYDVQKRATLFF